VSGLVHIWRAAHKKFQIVGIVTLTKATELATTRHQILTPNLY